MVADTSQIRTKFNHITPHFETEKFVRDGIYEQMYLKHLTAKQRLVETMLKEAKTQDVHFYLEYIIYVKSLYNEGFEPIPYIIYERLIKKNIKK